MLSGCTDRRFRGTYCLHHQGEVANVSLTTRRIIPEVYLHVIFFKLQNLLSLYSLCYV